MPLPVGPPLFEIMEEEKEDFDVFFFFLLLIDSSAVGACSAWEGIRSASLGFSSATIKKKRKKEKIDSHNKKAHFTFNNPLQFK